jgi:hypothetical protein
MQVPDVSFQRIIFFDKFLDAFGSSILRCNVQRGVSSAPPEIVAKQDSDSGRQFVFDLHEMPILFILCCQSSVFTELKVELLHHCVGAINSDLISHHLKFADWIQVSLFVLGRDNLLVGQVPIPLGLTHALPS